MIFFAGSGFSPINFRNFQIRNIKMIQEQRYRKINKKHNNYLKGLKISKHMNINIPR